MSLLPTAVHGRFLPSSLLLVSLRPSHARLTSSSLPAERSRVGDERSGRSEIGAETVKRAGKEKETLRGKQ